MTTLWGAICIFCGCGAIWYQLLSAQHKSMETPRQLLGALAQMQGEITSQGRPMPQIIAKLSCSRAGVAGQFFQCVDGYLHAGFTLEEGWALGVKRHLPKGECQDSMVELGHQLCGEEETICKGISLVCDQLSSIVEEQRKQSGDRQRRITALCFSAASLAVILLM